MPRRSRTHLCYRTIILSLNQGHVPSKKVSALLSHFTFFFGKPHSFTTTASFTDYSLPSPYTGHKTDKTQLDLSAINCSGIAQSFRSKSSRLFAASKGKRENSDSNASVKDLLFNVSDVIPGVARRFRRVLRLEAEDVLEILVGFQFECERAVIESVKVEALWGIFKRVSDQDKAFRHLPNSYEVMALILLRYGMLREVQLLLLMTERQEVVLDKTGVFCGLIEGYVGASDFERAVLVYDRMRELGSVLPLSCYRNLMNLLVRMKRTQLAFRLCLDMLNVEINVSYKEKAIFENVVRLLCGDGMIQEARNLVNKLLALGFEPSSSVLNEIARGYIEKMDFDDSVVFFAEMKCSPNISVGNKIVSSLCRSFGVERASLFRLELENLGFRPDEITFGILIGWSCSEGNLRDAFIYLSEMLSRGLKPTIWSYNALIAAGFKEGMWKHAQDIIDEMVDRGTNPNASTFRILLAGYCKFRKFDEAKMIVHDMVKQGLVEASSLEDPLSKAFMVLGLNPLSVRLKRDNGAGFSRTEFFDNLGNGLYLDTDTDKYEDILTGILEDSLIPDFSLLLRKECDQGNFNAALSMIDEMVLWGQEPSPPIFSALVVGLCASRSFIRVCSSLMEKMSKLANQLDDVVLNLLIQAYCKNGLTYKGRIIFNQMLERGLTIKNETYTALMKGFCKIRHLRYLHDCWDVAWNRKWLPGIADCKFFIEGLCRHGMLKEVLELLESMLVHWPQSRQEICHIFLEKLSVTGFTSIAHTLVDELLKQGFVLDDVAYSHLIRGFCKEQKYTVAFSILDTMMARNLVPQVDVSLTLISQLCRADRSERVVALREMVLRDKPMLSFSQHSALIKRFCVMGKVGEVTNLFLDISSNGPPQDAEILNILFQGYCIAKNLNKARELLGILVRKFLPLSIPSYRSWVHLMCKEGRVNSALNLKELMLEEKKSSNLIIYNILLFNLLSAENYSLVNKVLDEIQEKDLLLNEVAYNFLVYGFSKCKDVSSCLHYLSTMISKGLVPSYRSLRIVITMLCELGELSKALDLSREMELRGWVHGSIVQNAIVEGFLLHNKLQEAEGFLDCMADKGLIPKTINYDNLIKCFCYYGRLNKAIDLINTMLKKGNVPNCTSYDSVVQGLCKLDQLSQALDFHTEMLDLGLRPSIRTRQILVHQACRHGWTVEAERVLIAMVRAGEAPTRQMYSCVLDRYRFENNLRKVSEIMQMMQQSGYEPDFDTHWSLISNLSNSNDSDSRNGSQGFLSRLLSKSGFSGEKDTKAKQL